jgi:inhibitor of cysteine peptidase
MSVLSFSEPDDGRTVVGRIGELIDIRLPENATAGYRWTIERQDSDKLELVADKADYPERPLGSGGTASFIFRLRAAGSTTLALRYGRSWEGDDSVLKRYRLTVEIIGD